MSTFRAGSILAAFTVLTVPLMPVQAALVRLDPRLARRFPHWYHRQVCRLLGVRLHVNGTVARDQPVLLVANHTSWLDIPVLSAVAPVSFVAKKEVASWPFVSSLARLQRSVFIDRTRRTSVGQAANDILSRLAAGDAIVLFAEGTSSDGNRVLPFLTSLFAAAKPSDKDAVVPPNAVVQTLSIVYTRLHGIPIGRADRSHVGWYGNMEMKSHAWHLLKSGPLDVEIRVGPSVPLATFADRKELARQSEAQVREHVVRILRALPPDQEVNIAQPPGATAARRTGPGSVPGAKWM